MATQNKRLHSSLERGCIPLQTGKQTYGTNLSWDIFFLPRPSGERVALGEHLHEGGILRTRGVTHTVDEARILEDRL